MITKISKESPGMAEEKIHVLKQVIPECFSEGILDIEKLQKTIGQTLDSNDEKYSFNWAGKNDTFKNIQTTSKGSIVADKKYSINFDEAENIFIEGENLEVLKLLQKSYFEKIKMIYIDPPYNTGNDFIYPDDFSNNLQSYLEQTEQTERGIKLSSNPETSGRFHSDWISFMYARLFLARNLLKPDGVIFVSIDDNEVHNLKMIMNEIFGEENFLTNFIWKKKAGGGDDSGHIATEHEYIVCFARSSKSTVLGRIAHESPSMTAKYNRIENGVRYYLERLDKTSLTYSRSMDYEIECPDGTKIKPPQPNPSRPTSIWRWSKSKVESERDQLVFERDKKTDDWRIYTKTWESLEGVTPRSLLVDSEFGRNRDGTQEISAILGAKVFTNPKPVQLVRHLLKIGASEKDSLVLDFFAGSGTIGHAILDLNKEDNGNRKFILVQIPEICDSTSMAKEMGYDTIADICKERIRRVIQTMYGKNHQKKIGESADKNIGFKVFKLSKSNYKIWENYEGKDDKKLKEQMKLFESPLIEKYKDEDVIYECIIKEGFDLNSKIDKLDIKSNKIYKVSNGDQVFYITLDKSIKSDSVDKLNLKKDDTLICIDASLNDSQKTNLAKQCTLKTM